MPLRGYKAKRNTRKKKLLSSGLTLPGYNYLGPFNAVDNGPPLNPSDRAAQLHDAAYAKLQQKHGFLAPYIYSSDADDDFIEAAQDDDYGGRWGKRIFNWKRQVVPRLPGEPQPKRVRLTGDSDSKFIEKEDALPQSNSPSTANNTSSMPEGKGSGNYSDGATLKETPVDQVVNVSRGPPSYNFASLPYYRDYYTSVNNQSYEQFTFRMTSPYDCSVSQFNTDINTNTPVTNAPEAVADSSDVSPQTARWYNFYASLYNYYHTVSCRWHVTIENMQSEPIWVHMFYHGQQSPPAQASNIDILHWNDAESHLVGPVAHAMITGGREGEGLQANVNNVEDVPMTNPSNVNWTTQDHVAAKGASNILQLSGQYSPGDFKQEIHLDSEVENWTAVTANPTLSERLSFRIKPQWNFVETSQAASQARSIRIRLVYRCEYLVEFKELKATLRYPVQEQPIVATIYADPAVV